MEDIAIDQCRMHVLSKPHLFECVMDGTMNLKSIKGISNCHKNRVSHEQGLNQSASSVGDFRRNISNGMRKEGYEIPVTSLEVFIIVIVLLR